MVTRRTAKVQITLDAKNDARDELAALIDEEKILTREQAGLPSGKRGPVTKQINKNRAAQEKAQAVIDAGKITLTVAALTSSKYRNLMKNHPPREDDEFDQRIGYNEETFLAPFLTEATVAARDHEGKDVPLTIGAWLDEDDGLDPVDTLRWFNTALGLQTGRVNRSPQLRVS